MHIRIRRFLCHAQACFGYKSERRGRCGGQVRSIFGTVGEEGLQNAQHATVLHHSKEVGDNTLSVAVCHTCCAPQLVCPPQFAHLSHDVGADIGQTIHRDGLLRVCAHPLVLERLHPGAKALPTAVPGLLLGRARRGAALARALPCAPCEGGASAVSTGR